MSDKEALEQAQKVLESTRDLNSLMLENVDKLVKMNIELIESYSQIGIENYKAATEIRSIGDLKEYAARQRETAQEIAQRIAQDSKTVVEMISGYMTDAQKVAGGTLSLLSANPFLSMFGALGKTSNWLLKPQGATEKPGLKRVEPPEDVQ